MPIEVERKARVVDIDRVMALLAQRSTVEASTYSDTYYDWPDSALELNGRKELRVRVIDSETSSRTLLTFKGTMLDHASTPEFETTVGDAVTIDAILGGLGFVHVIAYRKRCWNYRFRAHDHDITTTLVQVPELGDERFIEVETVVDTADRTALAAEAIRGVLSDLGINERDLTDELYVDRVRANRISLQ